MILKGDVNNNGIIDIDDAVLIDLYVLGKVSLTDEQIEAANIVESPSGTITVADAFAIQRHILGTAVINGDKFYT